jgi:NAD(P)-dependent dehydrogenase (short-subunit alcohol dehydrogenase family)
MTSRIDGRLEKKTAVVTGAASGIGKGIALMFAAEGARVVLAVRNFESGEKLVQEIQKAGGIARAFHVELTREDEVKRLMEAVAGEFGGIDVLVNCAGIFAEGTLTQTDSDEWGKIFDTNLNGPFYCMKYALEYMLSSKRGSIINIASEAGIAAIPGQTAYNVSKAALIMLTKSAARDYAGEGIRINCVCPGRVLTPLVQKLIDGSPDPEKAFERLSHDRPVMRMGTVDDISHACLVFASDEMSYATGSVLTVDGGYTL